MEKYKELAHDRASVGAQLERAEALKQEILERAGRDEIDKRQALQQAHEQCASLEQRLTKQQNNNVQCGEKVTNIPERLIKQAARYLCQHLQYQHYIFHLLYVH